MRYPSAIGIDINEKTVCAVELKTARNGIRLHKCGSAPMPEGAFKNGTVVDPRAAAKAVQGALRRGRISVRGRRVAAALAGGGYVARNVQLPAGGPAAVREHIQQEVKRYAVFTHERTISDFAVDPGGTAGESRTAFVAAVAERRAGGVVDTLRRVRIDPAALDISVLAAARALSAGPLAAAGAAAVLALIEPGAVHLLVFRGKTIVFSHTALETVDLSEAAASGAGKLALMIRSVLDYYDSEIGALSDIERLVVCSDHEPSEAARSRLGASLAGLAVSYSHPGTVVNDAGIERGEGLLPPTACAVGLARRLIDGGSFAVNLNLLPPAVFKARDLKKRLVLTGVAAAGLLLCAFLAYGAVNWRRAGVDRELQDVYRSIASVKLSPEALRMQAEVKALRQTINAQSDFLQRAGPAASWPDLMEMIRTIIPKDLRLTLLEQDGRGGLLLAGEAMSVESVYGFVAPLDGGELTRSARLASLNEVGAMENQLLQFVLECELRLDGAANEGSEP